MTRAQRKLKSRLRKKWGRAPIISPFELWYYFNVLTRLERIKYTFGIWWYINGLPIRNGVLRLYNKICTNDEFTYEYYNSNVKALYPNKLNLNMVVMTNKGVGKIVDKEYPIDENGYPMLTSSPNIKVELFSFINERKKNKNTTLRSRSSWITMLDTDISQLLIYHEPSNEFIPITPMDYVYILNEDQEIQYRITKRGYATLSPLCKETNEYIKIFNEKRNGSDILKKLLKAGHVIHRQ